MTQDNMVTYTDFDIINCLDHLADVHTEKFLFAVDHPEFRNWFVSRVVCELKGEVDSSNVSRIVDEVMDVGE